MTSDTLGVEELREKIARLACPIYWELLDKHPCPVSANDYWLRRQRDSLELADAILALLPKGVDRGGKEEEGVIKRQSVLVSNDQTEAEPSAAERRNAEIEEAFDEAAKARDEVGFIGTPADCIRYLDAEVLALRAVAASPAGVSVEVPGTPENPALGASS